MTEISSIAFGRVLPVAFGLWMVCMRLYLEDVGRVVHCGSRSYWSGRAVYLVERTVDPVANDHRERERQKLPPGPPDLP